LLVDAGQAGSPAGIVTIRSIERVVVLDLYRQRAGGEARPRWVCQAKVGGVNVRVVKPDRREILRSLKEAEDAEGL